MNKQMRIIIIIVAIIAIALLLAGFQMLGSVPAIDKNSPIQGPQ